jgi:glycosyltransferase involved in cell wall biosynthesis
MPSVLYVCLQPRLGWGASQTHVDGVVKAWRAAGCRVALVELSVGGALVGRALRAAAAHVRFLFALQRADLVYVRMHPLALPAILLSRMRRRPVVLEVNGVPEDYYVAHPVLRRCAPVLERLLAACIRFADEVVAVTPGLRDWAGALRRDGRCLLLPNAADVDAFHPGLPRPSDVPDCYVLYFGALAAWQGVELVLAAATCSSWGSAVLVIIGDGDLGPRVAQVARERPDRVVWLGARRAEEMPPYVANAEATLALKEYHDDVAGQSPLKLYESMAAGVPVIASATQGLREPVEQSACGLVLEGLSPPVVADAVQQLLDSPEKRDAMGRNGRAAAVAQHTWHHRAMCILEVARLQVNPSDLS